MVEVAERTDPIEELESVAEILAYWHKHNGEPGFRELLAALAGGPAPAKPWLLSLEQRISITTYEKLEKIAGDLASRGLRKLAKITRDLAADRPHEIDLCPYKPGSTNEKAWLFRERQKVGLCPWCGSDKSSVAICNNGEPCVTRWQKMLTNIPRPR